MEMIMDGQCGAFNPLLLECLKDISGNIAHELDMDSKGEIDKQMLMNVTEEIIEDKISDQSSYSSKLLEAEHEKRVFFTSDIKEIQFEYDAQVETVSLSEYGAKLLGYESSVIYPYREKNEFLGDKGAELISKLRSTTAAAPDITPYETDITYNGKTSRYKIIARSLWTKDNPPKYIGALGRIIDTGSEEKN